MIIDVHTHPVCKDLTPTPDPQTLIKNLFGERAKTARSQMVINGFLFLHQNQTIEDFVKAFTSAGIDKAVIVPMDMTTEYGAQLGTNEDIARMMNKFPEKLVGFSSVDPRRKDAVQALEHAVKDLKLKGLKLVPPLQKFDISDRKYDPLWEKALDLNIPVWTHAGHQASVPTSVAKYGHPMLIDEVARRYPDLTIIMGHLSAPWFMDAWSLTLRHENVYLDVSVWYSLYPYFPWSAYTDNGIEHKLLFATDFPFTPFNIGIQAVKNLPISEGFKRKILGENAQKLLNIK
ncbi:MAG: amidohydrolase family protein [Candidatus Jordarchaeaceae archaeon]